jgi:hypothetical protein
MIVRKCTHKNPNGLICNKFFGTILGYRLHLGQRGCKSGKTLHEMGLWCGSEDVWWTPDLGHDDTEMGWFEAIEDNPNLPI